MLYHAVLVILALGVLLSVFYSYPDLRISLDRSDDDFLSSDAMALNITTFDIKLDLPRFEAAIDTPGCFIPRFDPWDPSVIGKVDPIAGEVEDECPRKGVPPLLRAKRKSVKDDVDVLFDKEAFDQHYKKDEVQSLDDVLCYVQEKLRGRREYPDTGLSLGPKVPIAPGETISLSHSVYLFQCVQAKNHSLHVFHENHVFYRPLHPQFETALTQLDEAANPPTGDVFLDAARKMNVLVLQLDSTSHLNALRQMNRTRSVLIDKYKAYDFWGFNSVWASTFPNVCPEYLGVFETDLAEFHKQYDELPFIWKDYMKKGYRSISLDEDSVLNAFTYAHRGFVKQPTHHYWPEWTRSSRDGDYLHRVPGCTHSRHTSQMLFDYALDFLNDTAGQGRPFFALLSFSRQIHESAGPLGKLDGSMARFFQQAWDANLLNNTVIFVLGDHGMRWGSLAYTFIGNFERTLPLMMVSMPPYFAERHPEIVKSLETNTRRYVTPFDIHRTLRDILDFQDPPAPNDSPTKHAELVEDIRQVMMKFNYSHKDLIVPPNITRHPKGFSLFREIPDDRNCETAGIGPTPCACMLGLPMRKPPLALQDASRVVVDHINTVLLKDHHDKCETLTLVNVTAVTPLTTASELSRHVNRNAGSDLYLLKGDYKVKFMAQPFDMLFTTVVSVDIKNRSYAVNGPIDRISEYGKTADCIPKELQWYRNYCYCKNNTKKRRRLRSRKFSTSRRDDYHRERESQLEPRGKMEHISFVL